LFGDERAREKRLAVSCNPTEFRYQLPATYLYNIVIILRLAIENRRTTGRGSIGADVVIIIMGTSRRTIYTPPRVLVDRVRPLSSWKSCDVNRFKTYVTATVVLECLQETYNNIRIISPSSSADVFLV